MLHKCANPRCHNAFRNITLGRLFQVESERKAHTLQRTDQSLKKPPRTVEHFWLCDECAASMTLTFDRTFGIVLTSRQNNVRKIKPARVERVNAGYDRNSRDVAN